MANCKCNVHEILEHAFESEMHLQGKEIDPDDELDWYSLTLGWAIGRGMKIEDAKNFASHIRYHTELG